MHVRDGYLFGDLLTYWLTKILFILCNSSATEIDQVFWNLSSDIALQIHSGLKRDRMCSDCDRQQ